MKKLVSLALVLVLCISMMAGILVSAEEPETYAKVTDGVLTSGKYILVDAGGYAPSHLDGSWILATQPVIEGDKIVAPEAGVWTLTVDGNSVVITDANGVSISPKGGNTNGIKEGAYAWNYVYADGTFSFNGTGEDTVSLAANVGSDNKYRAYKTGTIESQGQEKYPSLFTLYKLEVVEEEPVNPGTGDNAAIFFVMALMTISLGGIVLVKKVQF